MFWQQLVNGLTIGGVYALIALGYTMVYGIVELINFAHGEIFMIGAYIAIITASSLTGHFASSTAGGTSLMLLAIFGLALLYPGLYAVTMERLAYRPLRQAPRLSPLISALGMSIFFQNFVMITQGARPKVFPEILTFQPIRLGLVQITSLQLAMMITCLVLMGSLHFFVTKTRLGRAMRATAQDKKMAALVGIDVDRVITITFFIGAALAGAAGVMVSLYYRSVDFYIGYMAGLKAFAAAVLGGIGNIPGAMFGGILLGLVEGFGAAYISSEYKDAFAFVILIIVLIVRPTGIFGERIPDKS
jgi:branched-chain amino acid transport system permease protein